MKTNDELAEGTFIMSWSIILKRHIIIYLN